MPFLALVSICEALLSYWVGSQTRRDKNLAPINATRFLVSDDKTNTRSNYQAYKDLREAVQKLKN